MAHEPDTDSQSHLSGPLSLPRFGLKEPAEKQALGVQGEEEGGAATTSSHAGQSCRAAIPEVAGGGGPVLQ